MIREYLLVVVHVHGAGVSRNGNITVGGVTGVKRIINLPFGAVAADSEAETKGLQAGFTRSFS